MYGMRTRVLAFVVSIFVPILLSFGTVATGRAQQTVLPLWPHGAPEPPMTSDAEVDVTKPTDGLFNGKRSQRLTNVSKPTLTVYSPAPSKDAHVAALVFPGGGYLRLAWNGEGTDTCDWLTSIGVTCLLVKYRVPQPEGSAGHYPADPADLEDAQQAMRMARAHASEWHFSPDRIGVVGYSAGGNLAVLLSTHPDDAHILSTAAAPDVPTINGAPRDARPNFAIVAYPAYLTDDPTEKELDPIYTPNKFTPPTFVFQAENDKTYGRNAIVYYRALIDAHIPAELHYFASGGHGFGVHPNGTAAEHWTRMAAFWMHTSGILPSETTKPITVTNPTAPTSNGAAPCTLEPQPITPNPAGGNPAKPSSVNNHTSDPANPCPQ